MRITIAVNCRAIVSATAKCTLFIGISSGRHWRNVFALILYLFTSLASTQTHCHPPTPRSHRHLHVDNNDSLIYSVNCTDVVVAEHFRARSECSPPAKHFNVIEAGGHRRIFGNGKVFNLLQHHVRTFHCFVHNWNAGHVCSDGCCCRPFAEHKQLKLWKKNDELTSLCSLCDRLNYIFCF